MTPLLLSEISTEQVDLFKALLLLEEFIFAKKPSLIQPLDDLVEQCQQALSKENEVLGKVERFIDTLFVDLLWVDKKQVQWSISSFITANAIDQCHISPALKVILIQILAEKCGLLCDVVFIPDSLMVRLICDEDYAIIFDPITGESIDGLTLETRLNDIEGDPESIAIHGESNKILLRNYLLSLKNTLIADHQFQSALRCVDVLLAIKPNDPLERRDRGFLLHQLDCFKVAYDDYRYFVEQCPQDPAAQLLKIQLDNIKIENTVLH